MVAGVEHCQLRAAIEVLVPYTSPGARRYYDELQARGKTHHQAVHQLTNRWVGILHTCLQRDEIYDEEIAWQSEKPVAA